ncbi:MAG TPA: class I tRNA ligase family protein [Candidatus Azoamicus sp.]
MEKTFIDWSNNIKDWCISRQIWWGHRIPVWYDNRSNLYVGENDKVVRRKFNLPESLLLHQDDSVLDTWFSSALWPFASLGWPFKKKEYVKFYPTSTLVTGFDIIFFWVIRMLMFGIKFTGTIPFREVYIHGLIRDNLGNKMSKTKGNVIDPIDIIDGISYKDLLKKRIENLMTSKNKEIIVINTKKYFPEGIETFGVDALRLVFASMATDNMFLNLDFKKLDKYKKFCNKILNSSKFISTKLSNFSCIFYKTNFNNICNIWVLSVWQKVKKNLNLCIKNRNFSKLVSFIYYFFWNNFCDWYIEASKFLFNSLKFRSIMTKIICCLFSEVLLSMYPIIPTLINKIFNNNIFLNNNNLHYPKIETNFINLKTEFNFKVLKDLCFKLRSFKVFFKDFSNIIIFIKFSNIKSIKLFEQIKPLVCKMSNIQDIFIFKDINLNIRCIKIFFIDFYLIIPIFQLENEISFIKNKIEKMKIEKALLEKKITDIKFLNHAEPAVIKNKKEKLNTILRDISTFEQFLF